MKCHKNDTTFRRVTQGPFRERSRKVSASGNWSQGKVSNLTITEPFYSHILTMKGVSLHTTRFRRIHLSVFRHRLIKNCFAAQKFPGLSRTGVIAWRLQNVCDYLWNDLITYQCYFPLSRAKLLTTTKCFIRKPCVGHLMAKTGHDWTWTYKITLVIMTCWKPDSPPKKRSCITVCTTP